MAGRGEPLFAGAAEIVRELDAIGHVLGLATGKAMRGRQAVRERQGLHQHFGTLQTADRHPSKPHPMLLAAMSETGFCPKQAVLVGNITSDVEMARAAGVLALRVAWGNHPPEELAAAGAARILGHFDELLEIVKT